MFETPAAKGGTTDRSVRRPYRGTDVRTDRPSPPRLGGTGKDGSTGGETFSSLVVFPEG